MSHRDENMTAVVEESRVGFLRYSIHVDVLLACLRLIGNTLRHYDPCPWHGPASEFAIGGIRLSLEAA